MRVCAKCGKTKPDSEFSFWSTTVCRECRRAYRRFYREAHAEEIRARERKSRQRRRKARPRRLTLWRQIEEMTPRQRAKELPYHLLIDVRLPPRMFRKLQGRDLVGSEFTNDTLGEHTVYCPVITHTKQWLRVRRSWMESKDWRHFREKYLGEHPQCARCGQPANVVHYTGFFTLDATVINFGFLQVLEHPECFEALCYDCHYQEQKPLIEAEKEQLTSNRLPVQ